MTPTLIAALRALPPRAHAALADVEGPGWYVFSDDRTAYAERPKLALLLAGRLWLPCSPFVVLDAAVKVAEHARWELHCTSTRGAEAFVAPVRGATVHRAADPMLAALAVLGEVCR